MCLLMPERLRRWLSHDIGIDLGTANTLVYMRGRGIVVNEPSVVALNQRTQTIVAVGEEAKAMLGRTPQHIVAVRPIVDGVISDFEVTEEMLRYLLKKAQASDRKLLGPRVVIGVPSGITNVETRAVRDAATNAGARQVFIIEEPMAAAIGIRLPVHEARGSMIIDIGGGTTDIAVISLGGIVKSRNSRIAGDRFNHDVMAYVRNEFKTLIGDNTAEEIKMRIGSVVPGPEPMTMNIRGRDLVTGLPREIAVTDADVREAIGQSVDTLIETIKEVLETTPPEVVADIMQLGVFLTGGGALLRGLDLLLSEYLKIPVRIGEEPLTAVARGTGIVLENITKYKEVLIREDNVLPPTK